MDSVTRTLKESVNVKCIQSMSNVFTSLNYVSLQCLLFFEQLFSFQFFIFSPIQTLPIPPTCTAVPVTANSYCWPVEGVDNRSPPHLHMEAPASIFHLTVRSFPERSFKCQGSHYLHCLLNRCPKQPVGVTNAVARTQSSTQQQKMLASPTTTKKIKSVGLPFHFSGAPKKALPELLVWSPP